MCWLDYLRKHIRVTRTEKGVRLSGFDDFKKAFQDLYGSLTGRGKVGFTEGDWEIEKMDGIARYHEFGPRFRNCKFPISMTVTGQDGNLKPGLVPPEFRQDILGHIVPVMDKDKALSIPVLATVTGRDEEWKGPAFLEGMESWSASHTWHYGYRRKVTHRPKVHEVRRV